MQWLERFCTGKRSDENFPSAGAVLESPPDSRAPDHKSVENGNSLYLWSFHRFVRLADVHTPIVY